MERSLYQIRRDIDTGLYNFEKSESLASNGYEFLCNYNLKNEEIREDFRTIKWYTENGYGILPTAYNMYGELIDNYVAIYKRK